MSSYNMAIAVPIDFEIDTAPYRFVEYNAAGARAVDTAGGSASVIGVSGPPVASSTLAVDVSENNQGQVFVTGVVLIAAAAGSIAKGSLLDSDNEGKAQLATSTDRAFAIALEASTAEDHAIRCLLLTGAGTFVGLA